ncbi:MAG: HAD-IIA family hydrolase [Chloroflexota bacterium]
MLKPGLRDVECFLLDMDGTFYLGENLIEGALEFIEYLKKKNKTFLFLTNNSSKNRTQYAEKIRRLGLHIRDEDVLTSGEASSIFISDKYSNPKIFLAGTESLEEEFIKANFTLVQENPDLVLLGFDTNLNYQKLWKLCDLIRTGIPFIATHPDFNCPIEGGYMPDIGAVIAYIYASTGRKPDVIIGKPNRFIVDAAVKKTGFGIEKMAMVGDRLYTDIALGQTSGILTVLVLSGETHMDETVNSPFKADHIFEHLGAMTRWIQSSAE